MNCISTYAILIGVERYNDNINLPDLEQSFSNVRELRKILKSDTVGLPGENIVEKINPGDKIGLLKEIEQISLKEDIKTLIIYYAGHGILDDNGNHYLTISTSTRNSIHIDGLEITELSRVFKAIRNLKVILILDSCFSERAFEGFNSREFLLLASSAMNKTSKFPIGEEYSAFTNELIKIFREGIPNNLKTITWREIYTHLKQNLMNAGFPIPKISTQNEVDEIVAARNNYKEPIESLDEKWLNLIDNIAQFNKDLYKDIQQLKIIGGPLLTKQLKEKLLSYMPFLIGHFLVKIFRKEAVADDYFKLYEKSVQFLYFVFFMQLERFKSKEEIASYSDFNDFKTTFSQPPTQYITYNHLNRIAYDIRESNLPLFISEIDFDDPILQSTALNIEELKKSIDPDLQILKECIFVFLQKIGCLVNYEMVSIREIRLRYPKYKEMRFIHSMSVLNGDNPSRYEDWDKIGDTLKSKFIDHTEAAHSHSVLLINRKAKNPNDHINLWPLVIDANAHSTDKFIPDIYCYVGKLESGNVFSYEPILNIKGHLLKTIKELDSQADTKPFEELLT
jgi:hypothetical protein